MEGGKEQAQNVPNSEINPCDGDGKEGHTDGSSRDVPIHTDSEGAKKTVDMCVDGEEGKADGSSDKKIKWMMKKKKGTVEKWTLQVEKSPHHRPSSVLLFVVLVAIQKY